MAAAATCWALSVRRSSAGSELLTQPYVPGDIICFGVIHDVFYVPFVFIRFHSISIDFSSSHISADLFRYHFNSCKSTCIHGTSLYSITIYTISHLVQVHQHWFIAFHAIWCVRILMPPISEGGLSGLSTCMNGHCWAQACQTAADGLHEACMRACVCAGRGDARAGRGP